MNPAEAVTLALLAVAGLTMVAVNPRAAWRAVRR